MTEKLILWAQALDNASPDHFDIAGKALEPDDILQRQAAVSKVSSVIKGGMRVFEQDGVLLTADDQHFVVEIPSGQRDRAGRIAPIICCGAYDVTVADVADTLGASVPAALDDFAKSIGRTLLPSHLELIRSSFEDLKKKAATAKLRRTVGMWAIGLAVLLLAYWVKR